MLSSPQRGQRGGRELAKGCSCLLFLGFFSFFLPANFVYVFFTTSCCCLVYVPAMSALLIVVVVCALRSAYLLPFCSTYAPCTLPCNLPYTASALYNFFSPRLQPASLSAWCVSLTCLRSTSLAWPKVAVAVPAGGSCGGVLGGGWGEVQR